jgi:hypothetical protein
MPPLLWPHRNAVGNGTTQQLVHRCLVVGIRTLCGEVAVAGISHQQALAFQITAIIQVMIVNTRFITSLGIQSQFTIFYLCFLTSFIIDTIYTKKN